MSRRVCDFDVVFEVAFAVVLPKAYLSFLAEQFAEPPGAGKVDRYTLCFLSDPRLFPKASFRANYYYCRHPSIRTLDERFLARCKLGVLVSAGAAT
jgi:hypothetical protein